MKYSVTNFMWNSCCGSEEYWIWQYYVHLKLLEKIEYTHTKKKKEREKKSRNSEVASRKKIFLLRWQLLNVH